MNAEKTHLTLLAGILSTGPYLSAQARLCSAEAGMKPVIFAKRILSTLVTAVLLMCVSCGQSLPSSASIGELTKQVQQLTEENQRLRSLLAENGTSHVAQTAIAPSSATMLQRNADQQGLTHWLTLSSSKRHNSGCRYYRNSHGRPCRADEGIPCKICGG